MYDTLVKRIFFLADIQADKMAVAFKREELTYGELSERIKKIAYRLNYIGIKKGDRVMFSALSRLETVAVYLGIQYCGAVAVPVDKNALPENIAYIYNDTDAALLLTDRDMKEYSRICRIYSLKRIYSIDVVDMFEEETVYTMPSESDLAEILYTTGSTGKPKGVMLSYRAVYSILKNTIEGIGINETDILLLPLPLNHSFALRELRAMLYEGAAVILQNGFIFSKEIENNIRSYQCTALAVVPASIETISGQMQDRFAEIWGSFAILRPAQDLCRWNREKGL